MFNFLTKSNSLETEERSLLNTVLRNIAALIIGIAVCMAVNMGLVILLGNIFPAPEGVDPENLESIRANLHRYSSLQMLMPFIAHFMGSLIGSLVAALIAANHKLLWPVIIGLFHLLGGISMMVMLPESPLWFKALDLIGAYIPAALLGGYIGGGRKF